MLNRFLRPLLMLICLSLALPSWAQMRLADDNAIAAIKAATDGNYAQAYELAADDPLTADLISWLRLRRARGRLMHHGLGYDVVVKRHGRCDRIGGTVAAHEVPSSMLNPRTDQTCMPPL